MTKAATGAPAVATAPKIVRIDQPIASDFKADLKQVTFRVTGVTSLLMNNPASQIVRDVTPTRTVKKKSPEEEARLGLYKYEDGTLYAPCIWFRKAMITSASGKKQKTRSLGGILQNGGTFLVEENVPLFNPETLEVLTDTPGKDWEVDMRSVVINKARVLKARPKITNWMAEFNLIVDEEVISHIAVLNQLGEAGLRVGVGDYRVAKGGSFGRFDVMAINVIQTTS